MWLHLYCVMNENVNFHILTWVVQFMHWLRIPKSTEHQNDMHFTVWQHHRMNTNLCWKKDSFLLCDILKTYSNLPYHLWLRWLFEYIWVLPVTIDLFPIKFLQPPICVVWLVYVSDLPVDTLQYIYGTGSGTATTVSFIHSGYKLCIIYWRQQYLLLECS